MMFREKLRDRIRSLIDMLIGAGSNGKLTESKANYIAGALTEVRALEKLLDKIDEENAERIKSTPTRN